MESLRNLDLAILSYLNGLSGKSDFLDSILTIIVSDYCIPVILALTLFYLWFAGTNPGKRYMFQKTVLSAIVSLGLANLFVLVINDYYYRERPFFSENITLLFYAPTDSSFPANPAALSFALAFSVWLKAKVIGTYLFIFSAIWCISRIYAGIFFPTDIAAGATIGITASLMGYYLLRLLDPLPHLIIRVARVIHLA
jgi:undecaprenyl-diphosphatase